MSPYLTTLSKGTWSVSLTDECRRGQTCWLMGHNCGGVDQVLLGIASCVTWVNMHQLLNTGTTASKQHVVYLLTYKALWVLTRQQIWWVVLWKQRMRTKVLKYGSLKVDRIKCNQSKDFFQTQQSHRSVFFSVIYLCPSQWRTEIQYITHSVCFFIAAYKFMECALVAILLAFDAERTQSTVWTPSDPDTSVSSVRHFPVRSVSPCIACLWNGVSWF